MKAGVDAPEPALEQGGEGSGVASGSGVAGFFFGAGGPVGGIPHAGRHRPEQRQRHDQDEAVEPSGKPDLAVFEPEAAALEIGEHGLDAPAQAIIESLPGVGAVTATSFATA